MSENLPAFSFLLEGKDCTTPCKRSTITSQIITRHIIFTSKQSQMSLRTDILHLSSYRDTAPFTVGLQFDWFNSHQVEPITEYMKVKIELPRTDWLANNNLITKAYASLNFQQDYCKETV